MYAELRIPLAERSLLRLGNKLPHTRDNSMSNVTQSYLYQPAIKNCTA